MTLPSDSNHDDVSGFGALHNGDGLFWSINNLDKVAVGRVYTNNGNSVEYTYVVPLNLFAQRGLIVRGPGYGR